MDKQNKNWMYKFDAKESIYKDDKEIDTKVRTFIISKPNRRLREDGELFYASETSRFAKAGVLPKAAWNTILSNGGGSISEKEREIYGGLLIKFRDASFELQSILIKTENERTNLEKKRADEILVELEEIRKDIQSFEASQIAIFENTAEAKARNRTILWWVLHLAYEDNNGQNKPIFEGQSFDEKLDKYDFLEEGQENTFLISVIRRFTYLITLWFLGRIENDEDFEDFDKSFMKDGNENQEETVEELKEESSSSSSSEAKPEEPKVVESSSSSSEATVSQ
jgi:hypothetical protein